MLAEGVIVSRIMKANAAPLGSPWLWMFAFGHHEDRTPRHGYAAVLTFVVGVCWDRMMPRRSRSKHMRRGDTPNRAAPLL